VGLRSRLEMKGSNYVRGMRGQGHGDAGIEEDSVKRTGMKRWE
jgi:hypothetical protein